MKPYKKIKNNLMFSFTFLVTIPLIILTYIILFIVSNNIENEIEKNNYNITRLVASRINSFITQPQAMLNNVRDFVENNITDDKKSNQLLSIITKNYGTYDAIQVLDKNGIVRFSNDTSILGFDFSEQEYFKDVIDSTNKKHWSKVYSSITRGKPTSTFSFFSGKYVYAVALDLTVLSKTIQEIIIGKNSFMAILDEEGNYIAHSDTINVLQRKTELNFNYFLYKKGNPIEDIHLFYGDKEYLMQSFVMPENKWVILAAQEKNESYAPVYNIGNVFFIGIILSLIIIGFFSFKRIKTVTNPLSYLITKTKAISNGNYDNPLQLDSYEDFNILRDNFNTMLLNIKKREKELKELNLELEKRVSERTEELEQANKDLLSFSYTISHDLRAPIRAIKGFSEMLVSELDNNQNAEVKELLNDIQDNTYKMLKLVNDLLEFSRMGRRVVNKIEVDFNDLIAEALKEVQVSISNEQTKIVVHNVHSTKCDPSLIKQVFINLLSNAVKYSSKKEKPTIEVNSYIVGNDVIYNIKDNGVGFDMKYKDKLFQVFQRLHTDQEFEGTGIGLANIARVIKKHNGNIWAESKPGKGASFSFSLPLHE